MSHSNDPAQRYAAAVDALNARDWPRALSLARALLQGAPRHAGVHFIVGLAATQMRDLGLGLSHLHKAVLLNPSRMDYAAQCARALAQARMTRESIVMADRAAACSGEADAQSLDSLGIVYSQANEHGKAAAMFRRAAALLPRVANIRFNLSTSLTAIGALDDSERELEACIALDPRFWKAHLSLAQLRRQRPDDNHLPRLQALMPQAERDDDGTLYVNLALAKEQEDLARYDDAFAHLVAAKAPQKRKRGYTSARDQALFDALKDSLPEPLPTPAPGDPSNEPIFVIGMPRTGTTLVDRILSSHPQVHTAGELQNFSVVLKRLSGSTTAEMLDADTLQRAQGIDWRRLGREYIDSTRPGTGHVPHFVDKLPHNFLYAGHIARALPNARILCLRRDPLDVCLSNFRQLFTLSSPFYDYSFDIEDVGRYYVMFDRLMQHWHRVLPDRILDVQYEDIVDAQESSTRRLLDFCGLPWDAACLRFEENAAPVSTASAVQVRSPLNRNSLQRWRRYESHLGGLRAILADAGIALPD